ncbi:hypothetical protein P3S68_030366 [Capsicum galapagoense]
MMQQWLIDLVDHDQMENDEVEVNMPMGTPSKYQRKSSASGSGSSIASNVKGPMDTYFPQQPNEKKKMLSR